MAYTTKTRRPGRRVKLQWWPYIPTQPEWTDLPWAEAKAFRPEANGWIGYRDHGGQREFWFQEWGNAEYVIVSRPLTKDDGDPGANDPRPVRHRSTLRAYEPTH